MVKVSISFPNNTQVTVESEDPEVLPAMLAKVLRELPGDLVFSPISRRDPVYQPRAVEVVSEFDAPALSDADMEEASPLGEAMETQPDTPQNGSPPALERYRDSFTPDRVKAQQAAYSAAAELAFVQFCQSVNPMGDMRKVVVAIEGADRFLQMTSVDEQELQTLFDRVGWRQPNSFPQTLRNAARSTFRWLERVPGRAGHYTVTDLGRTTILEG
jgi:hypothetical protein